jgi:hypothetical protein
VSSKKLLIDSPNFFKKRNNKSTNNDLVKKNVNNVSKPLKNKKVLPNMNAWESAYKLFNKKGLDDFSLGDDDSDDEVWSFIINTLKLAVLSNIKISPKKTYNVDITASEIVKEIQKITSFIDEEFVDLATESFFDKISSDRFQENVDYKKNISTKARIVDKGKSEIPNLPKPPQQPPLKKKVCDVKDWPFVLRSMKATALGKISPNLKVVDENKFVISKALTLLKNTKKAVKEPVGVIKEGAIHKLSSKDKNLPKVSKVLTKKG